MDRQFPASHEGDVPTAHDHAAPQTEVSFLDLAIVLAKHKRLVIGLPLVVAVLAVVVSMSLPNVYTATTRLVSPAQSQSTAAALMGQLGGSLPGIASGALGVRNSADLYIGMLKSRSVADLLIKRFNLLDKFQVKRVSDARDRLGGKSRFVSGKESILTIEVDDEDPKFAADVANAYVDALIDLTNTLAVTEAGQRRVFLERQLQQARAQLTAAEAAARAGLQEGGVAVVEEQGKSMLAVTATLRGEIAAKEVKINSMAGFASEHNPELMLARQELVALRQQLTKLEGEGDSGRGGRPERNGPQGLKNVALLRDLKVSETLLGTLTRQYEIAKVEEAREGRVVQVLDVAVPPERKSKPARAMIVLISMFGAAIIAVVLAFLLESFANSRTRPGTGDKLRELKRYLWRR